MKYFVATKSFAKSYRVFREDTGFVGIFKKNLNEGKKVIGQEILGVTKLGQLVKVTERKNLMIIEW